MPRRLEFSEIEEDVDLFDELSAEETDRIWAVRARNRRIVDPETRRPE